MSDTGDTDLSLNKIRNDTEEHIRDAALAERPVLVEAPPSSGKTTAAVKLSADHPVTYLAARKDLYDQATSLAEEIEEVKSTTIPSPHRDCATFRGEYDDESDVADSPDSNAARVRRLYRRGVSAEDIHTAAREKIYTPCMGGGTCEYLEKLRKIRYNPDSYDLIIGNHQHADQEAYIQDRIVILDEFDADPFVVERPSDSDHSNVNRPGEIIPEFLDALADNADSFPSDTYADFTDLLVHRTDTEARNAALEWFETRKEEQDEPLQIRTEYSFFEPSSYQHGRADRHAPILVFSLLCMDRLGSGISRAPACGDERIQKAWDSANITPGTCCMRNRNTGVMWLLDPPDLTPAEQVIGLDGTPVVRLWRRVYTPEALWDNGGFRHEQVLPRERFDEYLTDVMNISVHQIADSMMYRAGGNISNNEKVENRFAAVTAREGERFALISPLKALDTYDSRGHLGPYVKPNGEDEEDEENELYDDRMALNYGRMLSSNVFEKEQLGLVYGIPYPGHDIIRQWAALFNENITPTGQGDELTFGEFGDQIFRHFAHHQVVQAILRFGRHEDVDEATVYVGTSALPEWVSPIKSFTFPEESKKSTVIESLIRADRADTRKPLVQQTVTSMVERIDEEISRPTIRGVLKELADTGLVTTHGEGHHGAQKYKWDGDTALQTATDGTQVLFVDTDVYILDINLPDKIDCSNNYR